MRCGWQAATMRRRHRWHKQRRRHRPYKAAGTMPRAAPCGGARGSQRHRPHWTRDERVAGWLPGPNGTTKAQRRSAVRTAPGGWVTIPASRRTMLRAAPRAAAPIGAPPKEGQGGMRRGAQPTEVSSTRQSTQPNELRSRGESGANPTPGGVGWRAAEPGAPDSPRRPRRPAPNLARPSSLSLSRAAPLSNRIWMRPAH